MWIRNRISIGCLALIISFGCCGAAMSAEQAPSATGSPCISESAFIKDRMQGIFRTQLASGALNLTGEDAWLRNYPLLATVCYEAYRMDRDELFLQQAYGSIINYFNYLFIERDRDGDFLIESALNSSQDMPLESAAFNSMLALDMENLARISMELGLPLRGLFWFDSTRMIKERIVSTCYDPDGSRFVSADRYNTGGKVLQDPFSLLPAYFKNVIGENISASILRRYLANPGAYRTGDSRSISASNTGDRDTESQRIEMLLENLLISGMLDRNGMEIQAESYRKEQLARLRPSLADAAQSPNSGVYDGFWSCRVTNLASKPIFPQFIELPLFAKIARAQELLNTKEFTDLSRNLEHVQLFIDSYRDEIMSVQSVDGPDAGTALAAVRGIYQSISIVRSRLKGGVYFSAYDRSELPGFDLERAFNDLLKDAITCLHQVESMIFNYQGAENGFCLKSRLLRERAVVGEMITIQLSVHVNRAPEQIRSIILSRGSVTDTLQYRDPYFEITPHNDPLTVDHPFWLPSDWLPGIHLIPFTVDVVMGTGERRKIHFTKSVYVDAPLSYYVSFPEGNTLQQWGVPLDIHLTKRAPYAMSIQTGWFSPSGLTLKEGPSQSLYMQENQAETSARIHVLAPNPLRPGAFPFVLKVFGNGMDIGTVSSTLFKHFQWIFVGPFTAGADALSKAYPPERHVNLLDTFNGRDGNLVWGMLPATAVAENGEIFVGDLLASYGVGYLYTVIKSTRDIRCPASLSGSVPAKLFINNEMVLETNPTSLRASPHKIIYLKKGLNNILLKIAGGESAKIYLNLGDDESLTSDEFNNNLWELVDGFKNFYDRRIEQFEVASTTQKIATLRYFSQEANSVSVIGTFNGWTPENSPLYEVSTGVWEISLHLAPGKYAYRFVVNHNKQVLDPHCPVQEPDGYGGYNSILYIK